MRILYGYSNCTDKTYNRIVSERNVSVLTPDQKYHGLLIKGLSANGAEVRCFSGLPINRAVTARKLIREPDEREGNAHFHYITTLNLPILRQLMIFCGTFFGVLKAKKDRQTVAVCDCLNIANAYGMTLAARLRKIPVVSIVTDLPDMERTSDYLKKFNNRLFHKTDAFILLTDEMSKRVNPEHKPYIVLEGHVDANAPQPEERTPYELSDGRKVILYAGSLKRIYGIVNLVEGFIKAQIPDAELNIYGDGDYREELEQLAEKYPGVHYLGVKKNYEIVEEEQKASLLVNPRPTAPEYTKYSFPSKNMEYMVSGTPTLTTKLPGMPAEYYPYVYLLEDESPDGVSEKLREIFAQSFEERRRKALSARKYVLEHKSNIAQSKKIMEFLQQEFMS